MYLAIWAVKLLLSKTAIMIQRFQTHPLKDLSVLAPVETGQSGTAGCVEPTPCGDKFYQKHNQSGFHGPIGKLKHNISDKFIPLNYIH